MMRSIIIEIVPAANCAGFIEDGEVNILMKYVRPKPMLCPRVSIAVKIDSSPLTGIRAFTGFEPFGSAPSHMMTPQNPAASAPRLNSPIT